MKVQDLTPGMLVDLEGDPYADPNQELKYEYAIVHAVDQETADCVCVYFDHDAVGFPTNHDVKAHQPEGALN